MNEHVAPAAETGEPALAITGSRQFPNWLAEQRLSLAFTTYQAGKLFFIGLQPDGRLSIFERTFNRCMGLCGDGESLYMSSLYQIWRFTNALVPGVLHDGYDRVYVPRVGHTTGDIDVHDMAIDEAGRPVFVNTLFGCLATIDDDHSFVPLWRPPFIDRLAAEDRCHLNGVAMENGKPHYVSAVSQSNVVDGWRERTADGGCVIDVVSNEIVADGLSMPHSPRFHQGKLWLLDSSTGYLGTVDLEAGEFEPLVFCPGYARGLCFSGDFAVISLSKPRHNRTFQGLALDGNLAERDAEARCGLMVVDLKSGDTVHWLRIEGVIEELYDVVALPGVVRPMALGFKTDEIRRFINIAEERTLAAEKT